MYYLILFLISCSLDKGATGSDPCTSFKRLEEEERSAAYVLKSGDIGISDDRLEPGWYRAVSNAGEEMPTAAPGIMKCKTLYPIWLNGLLPTNVNEQVSRRACLQNFISECSQTWNIEIKKCTGYLVYNLQRSPLAQSAYCFGTKVKCPAGQYSETGYTPDCTANVPSEAFSPAVVAELAEGAVFNSMFGPSLEAVFRCSFNNVVGKNYAYDIFWYIDDHSVIFHRRIQYSNISITLLRPVHWVDKYQMNMVVKCAVRARLDAASGPGPYYYSQLFEAGVKPEKTLYKVLEGQEILIPLTTSVPVGCVGSSSIILPHCIHTLKIAQPKYQSNPSETCTTNIEQESLAFETQNCGVTFNTTKWNSPVNLKVTGYIDNIYNSDDRTGYIRLKSSTSSIDLSHVWDNLNIPDIQVVVSDHDSAVSSRFCKTYNDPIYRTADGTEFTYNGCGEYILYRHKRYPYWVHTLTTSCWIGSQATCNCGIAIRSHDSLFVVRTCDVISTSFYASGRYYPSMSYHMCDNKHMVIEKRSGGYQVTLPTGTIISFSVSGSRINPITIQPSSLDIELTEGLCGFISKTINRADDFIPRGSNIPTSSHQIFASSWRVQPNSNEELFSAIPKFSSEDLFLKEYCICVDEAGPSDPIQTYNDVHCNLTQPMIQCKNTRTPLAKNLYQDCHKSRKRRDTGNSDDIMIDTPLTYASDYDPDYLPPEPVWRNGWDEDLARDACMNGISKMAALELCKRYAKLNESSYVESCVRDIMIAGDTTYLSYTIWLMKDACRLEISKNESLFRSNSSNGGQAVYNMITDLLCPSDCNNNGVCNNTECVCNEGFIGFDCSVRINVAPKEIIVPDDGLCSTKTRLCKSTNIFGVFYTENVYCRFRHFTVNNNGKQETGIETVTDASYQYENLVSCQFPTSRRKRSTSTVIEGYDMALSYDGTNYGNSVTIIIYDRDCFSCNTTTVTCVQLESCLTTTDISDISTEITSTSGTTMSATAGNTLGIEAGNTPESTTQNTQNSAAGMTTGIAVTTTGITSTTPFTSAGSTPIITTGIATGITPITSAEISTKSTPFTTTDVKTTMPTVSLADITTVSVTDESDLNDGLSPTTLGAVAGALSVFVLILVICIVYKCISTKIRRNKMGKRMVNVRTVFDTTAPFDTNLKPRRADSDLSFSWTDSSRSSTPVELFTAKSYY